MKLRTVINNPSKTFSTMTRVHLAQLLRDLTSAHDYAFFSAPDEYMPSEIDRYPAAWLAPPRLKEVEGRRHGKRTYEIQLLSIRPRTCAFTNHGEISQSATAEAVVWF